MVFGLATKKEISQIESLQYSQEYCKGFYNMSNIQYLVSIGSEIEGMILSKSILTPYAFTCQASYNISLEIDYNNEKNHLDYRLHFLYYFIFTYFVMISIVGIGYILYFIIYSWQKLYFKLYKIIPILYSFLLYGGIMIAVLFLFFWQVTIVGAFFENSENDEYSNFIEEFGNKGNEQTDYEKYNDYSYSLMAHMFIMFIYLTISYLFAFRNNSSYCARIVIFILMYALFILYITFQGTFSYYIPSIIFLFLIAVLCIYFCKEILMFQISMLFYYAGTLVAFPIGQLIIRKMPDKISHHYLAMILAMVFMICHFLCVVFLILSIIVFKEFEQFPVFVRITINAVLVPPVANSMIIQQNDNILLYTRNQNN